MKTKLLELAAAGALAYLGYMIIKKSVQEKNTYYVKAVATQYENYNTAPDNYNVIPLFDSKKVSYV